MGLFDYKNADGKALYSDAIALTLYAYTPTGQPSRRASAVMCDRP